MAKKNKKVRGVCYFFDEMEGKMQEEDTKRRRLSKKTTQSQPELLFLKLYPEGKTFDSFSNKCNSQPSGSNSHKKVWRPPIKVINETESDEFKGLGTRNNIYDNEKVLETRNEKSSLNNGNDYLTINCTEERLPFKVLSNLSENPFSYKRETEEGKENQFNLFSNLNVAVEKPFTVTTSTSDNSVNFNNYSVDERNRSQHSQVSRETSSSDTKKTIVDHFEHSEICTKDVLEQTKDSISNYSDNDNSILEIPNDSTFQMTPEYEQNNQGSTNQQQIADETMETCKDLEINKCYKYDEMPTQNNLFLAEDNETCCGIRIQEEHPERDYNEDEDILNSINMILSEGKDSNSEEEVDKGNMQETTEQKGEKNKFDSIFSNSYTSKDHGSQEVLVVESEHGFDKSEKQKEYVHVTEDSLSKNHDKTEDEKSYNFVEEDSSVIEEDVSENLPSGNKTKCLQNSTEENSITKENNENGTGMVQEENEENIADDEFSCLMISNSQLLAIENSYYEAPHNIMSNKQLPSFKEIRTEWDNGSTSIGIQTEIRNECNKRSNNVGTQTELVYSLQHTAAQKNVLPQGPVVHWDKKMHDTQRQLREMIQEVGRLNAMLLRVRQKLWPQRNPAESGYAFNKDDNATINIWQKN